MLFIAGFRTGLRRDDLPSKVVGAMANFYIPSSRNLNYAGNALYFFVNINVNGDGYGNFDGGKYSSYVNDVCKIHRQTSRTLKSTIDINEVPDTF